MDLRDYITIFLDTPSQSKQTISLSPASGKETIATSSPRLQRLLLRLAQYDVHIKYLRGKENVIADALSQVTPLKPELRDYNTTPTNIEKIPIHQITQTPLASPGRLQEFREATKNDSTLQEDGILYKGT